MPTFKSPFFASYNNRSFVAIGSKDQFFKGVILTPVTNRQSRTATYYAEKRPGLGSGYSTPAAGRTCYGLYASPSTGHNYAVFTNAGGGIDLWDSTNSVNVNCGVLGATQTAYCIFSETILGGITYILLTTSLFPAKSAGSLGWYLASDATANTAYTADGNNSVNLTDIKIAGVNNTAGLYAGQKLTAGANIVAGTRVLSVNAAAFTAVLDTATTGGAFNDLAITKEPVAKMNDVDFPTDIVGGFAELNGYIHIMTNSGRVYQSDLNTVSSWTAANYITCDKYADLGVGVFRYKNVLAAFSAGSIEYLYNAGNPAGATLASSDNAVFDKAATPAHGVNIVTAGNALYWLGSDSNIYGLQGYEPKKMSSYGAFAPTSLVGAVSAFILNKKTYLNIYYIFGSLAANTFWYCIDDDTWVDAAFGTIGSYATYMPASIGHSAFFALSNTSGIIFNMGDFLLANSTFQDNGVTNVLSEQFAIDGGTQKEKISLELRVLCDIAAGGILAASFSDDDGATYKGPFNIKLDTYALMRLGPDILGSWYGKRLFKFEHSQNAAWRGYEWELDYKVVT